MKRFACLVALMALSSPACARDYSFVFNGHDIHIEAARHCRSLSCVSVLVGDRHNRRDRDDDEVATMRSPAPAAAPAAAPARAQPLPAPVQTVPAATRAPAVPPPLAAQPAIQPVQAPVQASIQTPAQVLPAPMPAPALASAPSAPPASAPAVAVQAPPTPPRSLPPPSAAVPPAKAQQQAAIAKPEAKPQLPARTEEAESDPDTPIGDWRIDGKANLVRIESCGTALCGYVLDTATHTKGETILINMKPKNDTQWTGNVYSRASGNSYYGKMTLKDGKTLRVEACALGSFFCSGNDWIRIEQQPASADDLISSREAVARTRS
jgi:uncharacterized protein (DUF2147 family)